MTPKLAGISCLLPFVQQTGKITQGSTHVTTHCKGTPACLSPSCGEFRTLFQLFPSSQRAVSVTCTRSHLLPAWLLSHHLAAMVLPHCSGTWGWVPAGTACARITLHEANEPVHQAFLQASWEYKLWKWKVTQRHLCPSSVVTVIFFLRARRKGLFLHLPPIFEPSRC